MYASSGQHVPKFMRVLPVFILIAIFFSLAAEGVNSQDVVQKIESKYETINSVKCSFVQKVFNRLYSIEQMSEGTLYIRKPNCMRWEYTKPEQRIFILRDKKYLWYEPESHEIMEKAITPDHENMPFLFLSQKAKLSDIFKIGETKGENNGLWTIQLTPKTMNRNVDTIFLYVGNNFNIQGLSFKDMYGNKTEIFFSHLNYNLKLSDDLFAVNP